MVTRGKQGWIKQELDEGDQKVQISSYKKMSTRNAIYNVINIINTPVCYIWKLLRK